MRLEKSKQENKRKSLSEIERINFKELSEKLTLADEEQKALNRAMVLIDLGEAKIEVGESKEKIEVVIRLKKDNSILFYNDFGQEKYEELMKKSSD